ncbi:MAG TPA: hypothetical protein GXX25_14780 [Desulfotomaculum sp.]|nr:hypothetical protein [Desulfotomaculum sp.]
MSGSQPTSELMGRLWKLAGGLRNLSRDEFRQFAAWLGHVLKARLPEPVREKVDRIIGEVNPWEVRNVTLRQFPGPPFAIVKPGSWGLFGYFGRYRVERLGWIRVCATSWGNGMVVLVTGRELYFLSPVEPQRFFDALRVRLCGTAA